jgi:hypothetical protein
MPRRCVGAGLVSSLDASDEIQKPHRLPPAISLARRERSEHSRGLEERNRFIHTRTRTTSDGSRHRSRDHRMRGECVDQHPPRRISARSLTRRTQLPSAFEEVAGSGGRRRSEPNDRP